MRARRTCRSGKVRFVEITYPPFQSAREVRIHANFDPDSPSDRDRLSPSMVALWKIDSFTTTIDALVQIALGKAKRVF